MHKFSRTGIYIIAAELACLFVGATLPTPLYLLYRHSFGFSQTLLTLIYAIYVLGNLLSLFFLGRISDQIGRKKTSWMAIAIAILSTFAFACASHIWELFAARMLSGLAIGLGAGTATAWITDLYPQENKKEAAVTAATANLSGLAVGPLLSGLLAEYAPWPLHLSYGIYIAMLVVIAIAISGVRETIACPTTAFSKLSLQPRIGVPLEIRKLFLAPAITSFSVFAMFGFYAALLPGLLAESLHNDSPIVSGIMMTCLCITGAVAAQLGRTLKSHMAMLGGLASLLPGVALMLAAQQWQSMPCLIAAVLLGGAATALGYSGSLQVINRISPPEHRAEVVSSCLISCYIGNSVPVMGIGLLNNITSSMNAHIAFAAVLASFVVFGLINGVKYHRHGQA